MDQLTGMAVFAAVVEAGSLSAAARALAVSKSSVSKRISRLEDEMGVRLLNRTTRRLSLTEAGAAFYEGCRRVVAEAEAARETVAHLAAAPRGLLKVNAPMSFGVRHVGPWLPDFMARYPELAVELVLNDRVVDLIDEGFDVGIRIAALADSSLIARRLAPSRSILCAAPAYLERHGNPLSIEDLRAHECLLYSYQRTGGSWRLSGPGGERTVSVNGRLRVNNGDALLAAAVAGLGVTLLPCFICNEALRAGQVVQVLPEWNEPATNAIHAVFPANRNLSPKVRVFVDYLAARYGPTPYWEEGLGG